MKYTHWQRQQRRLNAQLVCSKSKSIRAVSSKFWQCKIFRTVYRVLNFEHVRLQTTNSFSASADFLIRLLLSKKLRTFRFRKFLWFTINVKTHHLPRVDLKRYRTNYHS